MAAVRGHLSKAPITEALIDVQLSPFQMDSKHLERIAESLGAYSLQGPIFQHSARFQVGLAAPQAVNLEKIGYRLHSTDGRYVVQIRPNALTLSRVNGYEDWETLLKEMGSVWDVFRRDIPAEVNISRVAVRYINRLNLPIRDGDRFEDFLTKPPEVPDELPQSVAAFMQRVLIVGDEGRLANVIQLLEEGSATEGSLPILLDIDAFTTVPTSFTNLWTTLSRLRDFKNSIFFASLQEKAVEHFL
jgi:uncharacterized protein (TIGR04255 family)